MKSKLINWGIIGAGKIATKFATDLSSVSNTQLYGVASRQIEKAIKFASKFEAIKTYDNYNELISDLNIDAIYIATPHSFHKEHSILCLKHKKPVLCEKPFAMNLNQVNEMIQISKSNHTLLMEALWTAFLPHFKYVQNLITIKHFGDVLKLEADFGFYSEYDKTSRVFNKSLGGGSLLDIGIYPIFLALSTLGEPNAIEADASFFDTGVDSECKMLFKYNDCNAFLKSTLLKETKTEAIFYCEEGIIKINGRFHQPTSVISINKQGVSELKNFDYKTLGYSYEIEHFNQLIRDEITQSDVMSFERSQQLIETLDRVRALIGLTYS